MLKSCRRQQKTSRRSLFCFRKSLPLQRETVSRNRSGGSREGGAEASRQAVREPGESPGQSRCCEFPTEASFRLPKVTGMCQACWEGRKRCRNESEDLPCLLSSAITPREDGPADATSPCRPLEWSQGGYAVCNQTCGGIADGDASDGESSFIHCTIRCDDTMMWHRTCFFIVIIRQKF